jgi:lipopolysaccharide/colanic/teichoic acid biosynthesis glycosyltransferase
MAASVELILQRIQQNRFMEHSPSSEFPDIDEVFLTFKQNTASMLAKRLFDLILTIPVLIICLPVFLIIAFFIWIDSPGPAIFKQKRVGKEGRLFNIYKFRTMRDGTESLGKYFIADNDECITWTGKLLRKYKIDELPQLLNVIKGDMSLVGPRAMIPKIVAQYPASVKNIVLSVPPGITGLASVAYIDENEILSASSNPKYLYDKHILPMKLHYYVYYVFAHNIWLDLKIIFLTFVYLGRLVYGSIYKKEHQKLHVKW